MRMIIMITMIVVMRIGIRIMRKMMMTIIRERRAIIVMSIREMKMISRLWRIWIIKNIRLLIIGCMMGLI